MQVTPVNEKLMASFFVVKKKGAIKIDIKQKKKEEYGMQLAYKGFDPDLSCRGLKFKQTEWNEEPEANCVKNGFHCAENPLDCLTYYRNMDRSVYYVVAVDGDIDEDGYDTKIAGTRMKLVKQLSKLEFVAHALKYMQAHPYRRDSNNVEQEKGEVTSNHFVIVRGKDPVAKGKSGDILAFCKEEANSKKIVDMDMWEVGKDNLLPDVWYDMNGQRR